MTATRQECRYVGRLEPTDSTGRLFDDEVDASVLRSALTEVELIHIDDPMSFPWEDFGPILTPLVVVDLDGCSDDDITALRPMLAVLTKADTILNSHDASNPDSESGIAAELATRTVPPPDELFEELAELKRLELAEQEIREHISAVFGDVVIVERLDFSTLSKNATSVESYLADSAERLGARPVAMWGVRREPGVSPSHGLVVFEPGGLS